MTRRSSSSLSPFPAFRALTVAGVVSACAFFFTFGAWALPVTERLDLTVGAERFLKVPPNPRILIDPPDLITFEALPSREAFVVAKQPGRGLLFVASDTENVFQVVTLRIHAPGQPLPKQNHTPEELVAAQRACPGLTLQNTRYGDEMEADVKTLECRSALFPLLRGDVFLRKNVAFSFTGDLLRQQLAIFEQRLTKVGLAENFQLFYRGPTLVIRGKATPEQRMSLYRIVWEETIGSFLFEDQSERLPSLVTNSDERPAPEPEVSTIRIQSIAEMEKEHPELFEKENQNKNLK